MKMEKQKKGQSLILVDGCRDKAGHALLYSGMI